MADQNVKETNLGCLGEFIITAIVYALLLVILTITIRVVTGIPITVRGGLLIWMLATAVVGWFATLRYKKRMEKQLGRKIKGQHELSSITSWMEAAQKDEKPTLIGAQPDMSPKDRSALARDNLEKILSTYQREGKQSAHDLVDKLIPPDKNPDRVKEPEKQIERIVAEPTDVEYKIITAGGRENGPLDVNDIRELFARGLVNKDTLVFVQSLNQWCPIADVFDIAKWNNAKHRTMLDNKLGLS